MVGEREGSLTARLRKTIICPLVSCGRRKRRKSDSWTEKDDALSTCYLWSEKEKEVWQLDWERRCFVHLLVVVGEREGSLTAGLRKTMLCPLVSCGRRKRRKSWQLDWERRYFVGRVLWRRPSLRSASTTGPVCLAWGLASWNRETDRKTKRNRNKKIDCCRLKLTTLWTFSDSGNISSKIGTLLPSPHPPPIVAKPTFLTMSRSKWKVKRPPSITICRQSNKLSDTSVFEDVMIPLMTLLNRR